MTAVSIALKAAIEANWVVGSGGTEPPVYGTDSTSWPVDEEWIRLLGWTYTRRRRRLNDSYVAGVYRIDMRVTTINHADKETRLDQIITELDSILTP
jgi:hypothetical protein